jgi:hypothetical protein
MEASNWIVAACAQLRLYNAKAQKLNESTFVAQARVGRPIIRFLAGPFRVVREGGPDEEAMEAFVLTFRLFVQSTKRDGLSFQEIDALYDSLPVSARLRREVADIRADINRFLDSASPMIVDGTVVTRRDLLMTWLYGEVAHQNPSRREQLAKWRVGDDDRPIWQHEFETVMLRVLQSIFWMRQANIAALAEMDDAVSQG